MKPRVCKNCLTPFIGKSYCCSPLCGQQLRRLRELDWHIRHTLEINSPPQFLRVLRGAKVR